MVGWWVPGAPVRTSSASVLATSYVRSGRTLVALGNWAERDETVRLSVDWRALGLSAARARLRAPAIEGFQPAGSWATSASLTIPAKKGLLLVIE
jgi:hypothetical protein